MKTFRALFVVLLGCVCAWSMSSDELNQSGRNMTAGQIAAPARSTPDGSAGVINSHAKFQQPVRDNNVYVCASTNTVTTFPGLNTYATLALYNPSGSNKSLVIDEASLNTTGAQVAAIFSLSYSLGQPVPVAGSLFVPSVSNAQLNAYPGSYKASPVGVCLSSATLAATPVAFRYIGGNTGASITSFPKRDDTDGKIIVAPGMTVAFQATAAVAMQGYFEWEEIPYP